jgi:hypothetical protein
LSSFAYLALDADYDPVFADNTSLSGVQAVAQAVLTNLKLFYGEWWEDLSLGLPVFQSMLGQLSTARNLNAMSLLIQQTILATPNVTGVSLVQTSYDNGQFGFTAQFQTTFGPATLNSTLPGLVASLSY